MYEAKEIKVLDHGFVRLINHMGGDVDVSRAARVSYDAPPREEDAKLINYLWDHRHTTPFESVTFTFDIKAPIFVFRQWHRHRTWSYNELSARYKELPTEYYLPDPELIGTQAVKNKQGRDVASDADLELIAKRQQELIGVDVMMQLAFRTYNELLAQGWPRELARSVLPVATYSHMFCTVNLLNLLKFLTLRCDSHAQHEIRVYADAMLELIRPIVPICVGAWEKSFKGE